MILPFERITNSDFETEETGAEFAQWILANRSNGECSFIAMYGDLGAGKTAFVRGAASIIAPNAHVQSPTYTVVNEYKGCCCDLFHFDFYRIDDEDALLSIGYWDYLERNAVAFCEWSEKIPFALPDTYYVVRIEKINDNTDRKIGITAMNQAEGN